MKSLRLNKEMRETILSNFVDKYIVANPAPVKPDISADKLKNKIACKLQQHLYGKYENLIPKEFHNTAYYVKVQLPNESIANWNFGTNENNDTIYLLSTKENKVEYVFTDTDPFWLEYQKDIVMVKEYNTLKEAYDKELRKFKDEVLQVLNSVNTTGQLVEVWPEAEPFLPKEIANPSTINLPAVNFAELNKVIAL